MIRNKTDAISEIPKREKEREEKEDLDTPPRGNPDGYQKKGVAGEAKGIVIKRKGIGNWSQMGKGETRGSGKSGVRKFEWEPTIHAKI